MQDFEKSNGDVPINLDSLRLPQDFAVSVKKLLTVPVRKPDRQEFVRVHPDDMYQLATLVLELKEKHEMYLVAPELRAELAGELAPRLLLTAVNRSNALFLWPLRLPSEDGRLDLWSASATRAAQEAKERWVRVVADMSVGAYEVSVATGQLSEPAWPTRPFGEILNIAFQRRYIDRLDHPVIRKLRGEF